MNQNSTALLLCFAILIYPVSSARRDIVRLSKNVDFLLDSVLEFRQELRRLQDDVASLQQLRNESSEDQGSPVDKAGPTENSLVTWADDTESIRQDIYEQMATVFAGFREEKSNIRRTLLENFLLIQGNVTDSVNISNQMQLKIIKEFMEQVGTTIGAMNTTLSEVKDSLANSVDTISTRVGEMEVEMEERGALFGSFVAAADLDAVKSDLQGMIDEQKGLKESAGKPTLLEMLGQGYRLHGHSLYKLYDTKTSWENARQQCEDDSAYLAEVSDGKELAVILSIAGGYYAWIGGTDLNEAKEWRWSKSGQEINKSLWSPDEPNNSGGIEHCAHTKPFNVTKNLNDNRCFIEFAYICEFGQL